MASSSRLPERISTCLFSIDYVSLLSKKSSKDSSLGLDILFFTKRTVTKPLS